MLEITWPGWSVLYGTGSRLFHAIATWPTPEPVIICDRTVEGLKAQMREAETSRAAPLDPDLHLGHHRPLLSRHGGPVPSPIKVAVPSEDVPREAIKAPARCVTRAGRPPGPPASSRQEPSRVNPPTPGPAHRTTADIPRLVHRSRREPRPLDRHALPPLTTQEHKAGAKYFLQRASPDRLTTALTDQVETRIATAAKASSESS